jgi:hypothetical protein
VIRGSWARAVAHNVTRARAAEPAVGALAADPPGPGPGWPWLRSGCRPKNGGS